jgi:hypothetical protein
MGNDDISIILKTSQGRIIEDATMSTVRLLMADMEKKAISKEEFGELLPLILDNETGLKVSCHHIFSALQSLTLI